MLKGLMFLHLKKDLAADAIDCLPGPDAPQAPKQTQQREDVERTCYGVDKDVQRRLAAIRTDLDSFNDAEACALMASGYMMTEYEFPRALPAFPIPDQIDPPWRFLKVKELIQGHSTSDKRCHELKTLLHVGRQGAFKIWHAHRVLKPVGTILLLLAAILAMYACYAWRDTAVITYGSIGIFLGSLAGGIALAKIFGPSIAKLLSSFGTPKRIQVQIWRMAVYLVFAFVGVVIAWVHIEIFDRWYLRRGSLEQVTGEPAAPTKKAQ